MGSNVPLTRTPDAHFLAEARYRGTKVISISPDFAESTKFADDWMSIRQGTDGALAMAMGHVILQEFYVNQKTERFIDYAKQYTDFPFLVTLNKEGGQFTAGRFLHAKDIGRRTEHDEWKPAVWDEETGDFAIPQGTMGSRWDGKGKWNLRMIDEETGQQISPRLSMLGKEDMIGTVKIPYFSHDGNKVLERPLPIKKLNLNGEEVFVATVFDLTLANYGVNRGIGGQTAESFDDPEPFTPAWQEQITGVDRGQVVKIAREFAQNAIDTDGRSMIIVGAGINHWFNSDTIYRAVLNLVLLVGAQGVNGGGWAHYVGQEKLRPAEGWQTIAMAKDWGGPAKLQNGTSFFYFATDQWRYEDEPISNLASPITGTSRYKHHADYNVLAARLGWLPSYPTFEKTGLIYIRKRNNRAPGTFRKSGHTSPNSLKIKN